MAPTKAKVNGKKVPTPKRIKRACRKRLANPENQSSDEQPPRAVQQDLSQKCYALLLVVTDLSTWVAAYEGGQDQGEASGKLVLSHLPPEVGPGIR